ncbi:MAG TPA: TrmH family RNA methyltransferase [Ktedonobacteraceae bacterium]|nr:TrmH family RNA methyltransferase [Ktedonobacteraceae bacterium]
MISNTPDSAGQQLSGEELHARQKKQLTDVKGPTVVAVGVADPFNIGSIFRICEAAACKEIIFVDSTEIGVQKVKRASRHTSAMVPYQTCSMEEFMDMVEGLPTLVAVEITSQSTDVFTTHLPQDVTLVVGGERYGIPEEILQHCAYAVHIPMFGINSSMNVATSLGIVLYEWHRRYRTLSSKS